MAIQFPERLDEEGGREQPEDLKAKYKRETPISAE